MQELWSKYKWYVIGYAVWVCLIYVWIAEEWNWNTFNYTRNFVTLAVLVPLCLYVLIYFFRKWKNKKEEK